jgi:hypothetical protein
MTDGSCPPHGASTLRHEYFDLKSSEDGNITHGVFVCIESATRGPSVDTTYMCLNKEVKAILTKIAHCPSAWWYWHWVEKGYSQGTIASLFNSFESDAADNAHDSSYNPQFMTVTSMFAGDDKNQWLDQVEEEFGSDLSDHAEDNIGASGTTIELGMDAKASLAKGMKGKDYDLEGVDSRSSKRTHCTNMTGKIGMMSTRSVTTKKYAMDFSQNKKDLNAEWKKTTILEQRLKEMELALAAGIVHFGGGKNTAGLDDRVMEAGRLALGSDDLLPNNAAMAALQQCLDVEVLASAIAALHDDKDDEPVRISARLPPPHSKKKLVNHCNAHLAKKLLYS